MKGHGNCKIFSVTRNESVFNFFSESDATYNQTDKSQFTLKNQSKCKVGINRFFDTLIDNDIAEVLYNLIRTNDFLTLELRQCRFCKLHTNFINENA